MYILRGLMLVGISTSVFPRPRGSPSALEALIGRPVESPRDKIRKKSRRIRSFPDFFPESLFETEGETPSV